MLKNKHKKVVGIYKGDKKIYANENPEIIWGGGTPIDKEEDVVLLENSDIYTYYFQYDERVIISKGGNGLIQILYEGDSRDTTTTLKVKIIGIKEGSDIFFIQKFNSKLEPIELIKVNLIVKSAYDATTGLAFSISHPYYKYDSSSKEYKFNITNYICGIFPIISNHLYYDQVQDKKNVYIYNSPLTNFNYNVKLTRGPNIDNLDAILNLFDQLAYDYSSIKNFINEKEDPDAFILNDNEIMLACDTKYDSQRRPHYDKLIYSFGSYYNTTTYGIQSSHSMTSNFYSTYSSYQLRFFIYNSPINTEKIINGYILYFQAGNEDSNFHISSSYRNNYNYPAGSYRLVNSTTTSYGENENIPTANLGEGWFKNKLPAGSIFFSHLKYINGTPTMMGSVIRYGK